VWATKGWLYSLPVMDAVFHLFAKLGRATLAMRAGKQVVLLFLTVAWPSLAGWIFWADRSERIRPHRP